MQNSGISSLKIHHARGAVNKSLDQFLMIFFVYRLNPPPAKIPTNRTIKSYILGLCLLLGGGLGGSWTLEGLGEACVSCPVLSIPARAGEPTDVDRPTNTAGSFAVSPVYRQREHSGTCASLNVLRWHACTVLMGANSPVLVRKTGQWCSFVLPKETGKNGRAAVKHFFRLED